MNVLQLSRDAQHGAYLQNRRGTKKVPELTLDEVELVHKN